jgi:hypothetical protein
VYSRRPRRRGGRTFDVGAIAATSHDPEKWGSDGTTQKSMTDGAHETTFAHIADAAAIACTKFVRH